MTTIALPTAPEKYDTRDQRVLRTELERVFQRMWAAGNDLRLQNGERLFQSYAHGIVAAGTNQATAKPLGARMNHVSGVAAGTGVQLWPAQAGLIQTVINRGAGALLVYGGIASDTVNGGVSFSQAANAVVSYYCPMLGSWFA